MSWTARNTALYPDCGAVTPHDTNANVWSGLFVGTLGDVKVKTAGGSIVTFTNVPSGTFLPISTVLVYDADTDAEDIVGFRG